MSWAGARQRGGRPHRYSAGEESAKWAAFGADQRQCVCRAPNQALKNALVQRNLEATSGWRDPSPSAALRTSSCWKP